ncbi:hypothetical protein JHJ32_05940 [Parapedobacter sp. ISTM3]|uniref:HMA domain-containing protein n=1 Tax=Parapedobacter luteus TaxID=623280 RepID=A0A1T5BHP5_9SPHI|nr:MULTISPECIES: hypothetical protein [Parapedobacter]MBK1439517.1 hypothetical protein [Parapedobacter sp. ISTM3]SKB46343.1 hypothetical protein SAMN05660226_01461 [Parapedobacter luteus]
METLKFMTDIDSPKEFSRIKSMLDRFSEIKEWELDFDSIYNLLVVKAINLKSSVIADALSALGYNATLLYEE